MKDEEFVKNQKEIYDRTLGEIQKVKRLSENISDQDL